MFYITNQGKERVTTEYSIPEPAIGVWMYSHRFEDANDYIMVEHVEYGCGEPYQVLHEESPLGDYIINSIPQ